MIPKTFHRIWVGFEMPEEFQRYGTRLAELHPAWRVIDWDESSLPELANQALYERADEIAPENVGQLKADIARLELLYTLGGVYVDADMEPRKPLDDLLEGVTLFAAWETDNVWINNAILGACAADPFIGALIVGLSQSVREHAGARPNVMTGPQYLTRRYRKLKPKMTVFPSALFYPYSWSELDREGEEFPAAFTVHKWNNRRRKAPA
jgi:inositol phosphorylceramide mannosyltransferase catalytic subunit